MGIVLRAARGLTYRACCASRQGLAQRLKADPRGGFLPALPSPSSFTRYHYADKTALLKDSRANRLSYPVVVENTHFLEIFRAHAACQCSDQHAGNPIIRDEVHAMLIQVFTSTPPALRRFSGASLPVCIHPVLCDIFRMSHNNIN